MTTPYTNTKKTKRKSTVYEKQYNKLATEQHETHRVVRKQTQILIHIELPYRVALVSTNSVISKVDEQI